MVATTDPPTAALAWLNDSGEPMTYAALSEHTRIPASTLWYRKNGRPSRREAAARRQYLTPSEEKGLVDYLLWTWKLGRPMPAKLLPHLAFSIVRRRSSTFQTLVSDTDLKPPGKNWIKGFYKRHPELRGRRKRPLEHARFDIYSKVVDWFNLFEKLLLDPLILPENIYNMDETGTRLSVPSSRKYVVGKSDTEDVRGPKVNRVHVTALECISMDGRCLEPLIIWPAATLRSDWHLHPTPGWHFGCTETGYSNGKTVLDWYRKVFDPQTKDRANGRLRVLVNDGYGSHESLEVMQFCHENNIILVRFPSNSTHKVQPCDVGVFAPLKVYYRQQVDELCRGGVVTIGKQHFIEMYSKSRAEALTPHNVKAAWARAGLCPPNRDRVLRTIPKPPVANSHTVPVATSLPEEELPPQTPVTFDGIISLRRLIEQNSHALDPDSFVFIQKLVNSAERVVTARDVLFEENSELVKQNNTNAARASRKSVMVGKAKVMSYEDIVEAMKKREEKDAAKGNGGGRKGRKPVSAARKGKESREKEIEQALRELEHEEWGVYGSVF